jgi:uncharacterized protein
LLSRTFYLPQRLNIELFRSLSEDIQPKLIAALPRDTPAERRMFHFMMRAHGESRDPDKHEADASEVAWLALAVRTRRDIVAREGESAIAKLSANAGRQPTMAER